MAIKTREKLLEVARQLFALKGVAHTTMNDIAAASAKGRRTIYTYFKNKKEIYNALIESESDAMVDSLSKITDSGMAVEEKLEMFLRVCLSRYVTTNAGASVKAWLKFDSRRLEKVEKMAREKEHDILNKILEEGILAGKFSAVRCGLFRGFMNMVLPYENTEIFDPKEEAERKKSIEAFIKFIVTDISIKNGNN